MKVSFLHFIYVDANFKIQIPYFGLDFVTLYGFCVFLTDWNWVRLEFYFVCGRGL